MEKDSEFPDLFDYMYNNFYTTNKLLETKVIWRFFYASEKSYKCILLQGTLPSCFISLVIEENSLFVEEFLDKLIKLNYPKDQIFLHATIQNPSKFDLVKGTLEAQGYK